MDSRSSVASSQPRKATSPFRTLTVRTSSPSRRSGSPMRGHPSESKESRLLALVHNFQQLSLSPWMKQVEEIEGRQLRSKYLTDADQIFLSSASARNTAFMRNVETILREAVGENSCIENAVVRHAYAAWREGNLLGHRISKVLVQHEAHFKKLGMKVSVKAPAASSASAPSPYQQPFGGSPSQRSSRSATPTRGVSPARRSNSLPRSLQEISPPRPCVTYRVVRPGSPRARSELTPQARHSMLEGLESLSKLAVLSAEDIRWAKSIFSRLYPPEDCAQRFNTWMAELRTKLPASNGAR